jgi:hypothetical protein
LSLGKSIPAIRAIRPPISLVIPDRMFKKVSQQGRRRGKTGGVPSGAR